MTTESPTDMISLKVAREKYLSSLSVESVERLCRHKILKTACKPGGTKRARWMVSRAEVMRLAYQNSAAFHTFAS